MSCARGRHDHSAAKDPLSHGRLVHNRMRLYALTCSNTLVYGYFLMDSRTPIPSLLYMICCTPPLLSTEHCLLCVLTIQVFTSTCTSRVWLQCFILTCNVFLCSPTVFFLSSSCVPAPISMCALPFLPVSQLSSLVSTVSSLPGMCAHTELLIMVSTPDNTTTLTQAQNLIKPYPSHAHH